jgi:hypothetical protein
VTKDAFIEMQKLASRRETRRLAVWVGLGWGSVGGLVLLVLLGRDFLAGDKLVELVTPLVTTHRYLLLVGLAVLTMILAFAVNAVRPPKAAPCPHCGRSVFGWNARIALLTSNCGFCGERIIT